MASALIIAAAAAHLAVFVCFPYTGPLGLTFTAISVLLWSALALFLSGALRAAASWRGVLAAVFVLGCAFSALSFLPQKDGVSALEKLLDGRVPSKKDLYFGLLNVGVEYPALLPPAKPEEPV